MPAGPRLRGGSGSRCRTKSDDDNAVWSLSSSLLLSQLSSAPCQGGPTAFRSDDTLREHRVGDPAERGDVGAGDQIPGLAVLLGGGRGGRVNVGHDAV